MNAEFAASAGANAAAALDDGLGAAPARRRLGVVIQALPLPVVGEDGFGGSVRAAPGERPRRSRGGGGLAPALEAMLTNALAAATSVRTPVSVSQMSRLLEALGRVALVRPDAGRRSCAGCLRCSPRSRRTTSRRRRRGEAAVAAGRPRRRRGRGCAPRSWGVRRRAEGTRGDSDSDPRGGFGPDGRFFFFFFLARRRASSRRGLERRRGFGRVPAHAGGAPARSPPRTLCCRARFERGRRFANRHPGSRTRRPGGDPPSANARHFYFFSPPPEGDVGVVVTGGVRRPAVPPTRAPGLRRSSASLRSLRSLRSFASPPSHAQVFNAHLEAFAGQVESLRSSGQLSGAERGALAEALLAVAGPSGPARVREVLRWLLEPVRRRWFPAQGGPDAVGGRGGDGVARGFAVGVGGGARRGRERPRRRPLGPLRGALGPVPRRAAHGAVPPPIRRRPRPVRSRGQGRRSFERYSDDGGGIRERVERGVGRGGSRASPPVPRGDRSARGDAPPRGGVPRVGPPRVGVGVVRGAVRLDRRALDPRGRGSVARVGFTRALAMSPGEQAAHLVHGPARSSRSPAAARLPRAPRRRRRAIGSGASAIPRTRASRSWRSTRRGRFTPTRRWRRRRLGSRTPIWSTRETGTRARRFTRWRGRRSGGVRARTGRRGTRR